MIADMQSNSTLNSIVLTGKVHKISEIATFSELFIHLFYNVNVDKSVIEYRPLYVYFDFLCVFGKNHCLHMSGVGHLTLYRFRAVNTGGVTGKVRLANGWISLVNRNCDNSGKINTIQ